MPQLYGLTLVLPFGPALHSPEPLWSVDEMAMELNLPPELVSAMALNGLPHLDMDSRLMFNSEGRRQALIITGRLALLNFGLS